MTKIIEAGSNEDGEVYYVVGDVSRRTAWIAIRKMLITDCGIDPKKEPDSLPKIGDLEQCNFFYSDSDAGEYAGYYWWGTPKDPNAKPVGMGWIWSI